ncbi:MAG TPA: tRNA (guanine-N1)-methyltransferase [Aquaticitalea sp.]|nr:tRNA (guanine-N1)-methyltransferase [Aquaticitalea sp.]HNU60534.1 tRNA (guanine-N1)-methyltransferase [Aquaticitalea sp.]
MQLFKLSAFVLLTCFATTNIYSQQSNNEDKLSLSEGTIDNQFEYVIQRSNNYQDYKVIKKTWLYQLKAHTLDSLKAIHKNLDETKAIVSAQTNEINGLKEELASTNATLNTTREEKDNILLFGMQMSKSSYSALMWSIIGGLFLLLVIFIYNYNKSNRITRQSKQALADIEEEFEEHRRNALEREQIVRRQLQDEINKHKKA